MHSSEFTISRNARKKYKVNQKPFSGDQISFITDTVALGNLAQRISEETRFPTSPVELYALGFIHEIQHLILRKFEKENYFAFEEIYEQLSSEIGMERLLDLMKIYLEEFPTAEIILEKESSNDHLSEIRNRYAVLENLLLQHLANQNPANKKFSELIQDPRVTKSKIYRLVLSKLIDLINVKIEKKNDPSQTLLLEILNQPVDHSPNSTTGQMMFLLHQWKDVLGANTVARIVREFDMIKESNPQLSDDIEKERNIPEMVFSMDDPGEKNYSPDEDWMEKLVLIAKNCYVWLDQLSKQYQRSIKTLNQIPDEELDRLSEAGFTGLWLIGLWKRSVASKQIKQMMGRSDAVASAYSLMEYQISEDLGGWDALKNLKKRALERGIRLSADMVPNHMGIDSTWVVEHPERFLWLEKPPFPKYSFEGVDLSQSDNIGIYIEDHYYDKSDAAVVFKRVDRMNDEVRYIYHGNDGTDMPWNDTAQLDYLKADVREAVIQVILEVSKNFPIIRFDAAMALAKEHIQRLWYPTSGEGGSIPSRSNHGIQNEEFQTRMPTEFWRDVVDRVASETPDTLLMAEAFWLMEGYFVRTLGMHRVYNSAFMHMLKDEDNDKFRGMIKNVLEFDPLILQRFVNFMTNPDEKTAFEQYGSGKKYLGVCTLLAGMPGLPMFGHGQIEGYREKYGMEYMKSYLDEKPDKDLLKEHQQHIFPLLKQRELFADVKNFFLYDFVTENGKVNEDVIVFSNSLKDERREASNRYALIVYHNKFAETKGWIKTSVPYIEENSGDLLQTSLGEALNAEVSDKQFVIYRDLENNLEYIRSTKELISKGLFLELKAYQHHTFQEFQTIDDPDSTWQVVYDDLAGKGCRSLQARFDEMHSQPGMKKNKQTQQMSDPADGSLEDQDPEQK